MRAWFKYCLKPLILFSVASGLFALAAYYFAPKPDINSYTPYSSAYFDNQGSLLRLTLAEDDRYRLYQPLDGFSPQVVAATILYEDKDFFKHSGIDLSAMLRAGWDTYIKKSRRVGASTISMQVARLHWDIPTNKLHG